MSDTHPGSRLFRRLVSTNTLCCHLMWSQGKFAVNVERRRWDLQEYERKAVEEARKKAADNGQTHNKSNTRLLV